MICAKAKKELKEYNKRKRIYEKRKDEENKEWNMLVNKKICPRCGSRNIKERIIWYSIIMFFLPYSFGSRFICNNCNFKKESWS